MKSSRISGFYKLSLKDRVKKVQEFSGLTDDEVSLLLKDGSLHLAQADKMIENVIGTMPLPLGIAVNFKVNEKEILVPMAIEEPSVVAAASNAAKMTSGFEVECTDPVMIGQIQVIDIKNFDEAKKAILKNKNEILNRCNKKDSTLVKFGGGCKDVEVRKVGDMLVVHLLVDCRDAMGANAVNTMAEAVAPYIEELTGGKVNLKIISNLADKRLVKAKATFSAENLGGEGIVDGIIGAYKFASLDPYRAATHNKGIMNGVSAVAIATGNDFRALESGAHAYAGKGEGYNPLTKWSKDKNGNLVGELEMPMAIGTVGGATKVHPIAKISLKILGVQNAQELAEIMGAVGLAQNLAALRALAAEGIQKGHMELHARNIAITAGAEGDLADKVADKMVKEKQVSVSRAKELIEKFK